MNISKTFLTLALIIFVTSYGYSQEILTVKKREFKIPGQPDFRTAKRNLRKGYRYYRVKKIGTYEKALNHYLEAAKYNNANPELNYLLGVCYLKTGQGEKSLDFFEAAAQEKSNVAKDIYFQMGLAKMSQYKYKKAIKDFETYKGTLKPRELRNKGGEIQRRIAQCEKGIELMANPVRCFLDNLGAGVNTKYHEYSAVMDIQDTTLYFTSRRPETTGGKISPLNELYKEDIYYSHLSDKEWREATQAENMNTKYNDAIADISSDSKEMYVYLGKKSQGDLYRMKRKDNGKWVKTKKMKKISKKKYHESSASVTGDGLTMYFVTNKKRGGFGGKDIWVTHRKKVGRPWKKPVNIGNIINTKYDEASVKVSYDGKVLYFSSAGHSSIGGLDIFKSVQKEDGSWGIPKNIGYPINTPFDDMYFNMLDDGRTAYYTSHHEDNYGGLDIYEVVLRGKEKPTFISESKNENKLAYFEEAFNEVDIEKPVNIKVIQLSKVKGVVTDAYSNKPIEAQLELVDIETNEVVKKVLSYKSTGAYVVTLPPGKNYSLTVLAKDYFFHSENFVIADTSTHEVIHKDIQLQPMGVGAKIVLNNVFFDSGKSNLRPESFSELNRLVTILKEYPNLVIEISGHTDSKGSLAFNNKLSMKRAQSVVNYLVSQGTNQAQLVAKGYGPTVPRADNVTEEGRQLNRRVEAKILNN